MTLVQGRRFLGQYIRLVGRPWNDVTRELQDFLMKLLQNAVDGIPGGFLGTVPQATGATGDSGSQGAGWMAADAVIPQGIVTTKGDILTYSTEPARLPVGTNNFVLSADSTQPAGLKWIEGSYNPVTDPKALGLYG